MSGAAWVAALDALEQDLVALQLLAREGDAAGAPAVRVPVGLGPLPVELRPRAQAMLAAFQQAEADLQRDLSQTTRELAMLERVRPTRQPGASYLDEAL